MRRSLLSAVIAPVALLLVLTGCTPNPEATPLAADSDQDVAQVDEAGTPTPTDATPTEGPGSAVPEPVSAPPLDDAQGLCNRIMDGSELASMETPDGVPLKDQIAPMTGSYVATQLYGSDLQRVTCYAYNDATAPTVMVSFQIEQYADPAALEQTWALGAAVKDPSVPTFHLFEMDRGRGYYDETSGMGALYARSADRIFSLSVMGGAGFSTPEE